MISLDTCLIVERTHDFLRHVSYSRGNTSDTGIIVERMQ